MDDHFVHFDSRVARTYGDDRRAHRPLSVPVTRATTYQAESAEHHRRLFLAHDPAFYQRFANPTSEAAAAKIAELEGAEAALVFGSGMGAIATSLLAVLRAGDHLVLQRGAFAQTTTFVTGTLAGLGVAYTAVDPRRPEDVAAAIRPETRVVYVETPSNPLLHVVPLAALAEVVRGRGIELFVDGTFASPYLQRPLEHGATLVLHSGTKYLGGHSDVLCGAAAGGAELVERIRKVQFLVGTVLDPTAAWLLLRGIKTLAVRVARQSESALAIARFLAAHPEVARVRYPWLESDEGHAVARAQMRAGGGMVSFEPTGGVERARRMLDALRGIPIATSLGGTETIAELPFDLDFDEAHQNGDAAGARGEPAAARAGAGPPLGRAGERRRARRRPRPRAPRDRGPVIR
jgi:cystathionine beta-lyase/cystathionine gamma-synthase